MQLLQPSAIQINYVDFLQWNWLMLTKITGKILLKFWEINAAFLCWSHLLWGMERTLIREYFDHMLRNHFWTVNSYSCHAINKTMQLWLIFVKIHLNNFHAPKIYSFQNCYRKLSWGKAYAWALARGANQERKFRLKRKFNLSWMSRWGIFWALDRETEIKYCNN